MNEKKYFTISEAAKLLKISINRVRYLESTISNLTVTRVRNRRYYKQSDIEIIANKINQDKECKYLLAQDANSIIQRIDNLIYQYDLLSLRVNEYLS